MAIFTTLVAKHVNITLAQSNTYNRSGPASLKWLPLCSPARAPIARLVQVAIPRGNTEMQNVDKHGSVVLLSRLTEHKLSLSTLWSPTQSVFKPYASQFVLCHNIRPLQTTKTCTLQFSFLGLLSLSFPSFSPSPILVLFSLTLTLLFCCLCQKDHIPRLIIACLLATTPVAVNVVVWDGEESHALWPL